MIITINITNYSALNSVLELFTGSNCSNLTTLICNGDDDEGDNSVTFDTIDYLNTILLFRIGSYNSSDYQGNGIFDITEQIVELGKI